MMGSSSFTWRVIVPPDEALCRFRRGRRERSRHDQRFEAAFGVGAVAKRLVRGLSAAAERDHRAPREVERLSFLIYDLEIPLDANGTVVANRDGGSRHESSWVPFRAAAWRDPAPRRIDFEYILRAPWPISTSSP